MPVPTTVRGRLLAEINRRLLTIPNAVVFEAAGEISIEVRENDIGQVVAAQKKRAIEWEATDDQVEDRGGDSGSSLGAIGLDTYRFRVGVLIHLPDALPAADNTWAEAGADAVGDVYVLYAGTSGNEAAGVWNENATAGAGFNDGSPQLAMTTNTTSMGGAIGITGRGTRAVYHELEIVYRTQAGRPDVLGSGGITP